MQVTEPLIKLCLAELTQQAAAMQRYKDYYEGRHEILTSYAMQDSRANRKLIFNFPRSSTISGQLIMIKLHVTNGNDE